jgi:DnaD/phage-associated family protein
MPRRMITSGIWVDAEYAALTVRQRLLWIGLITNADDQGRLVGHPGMVRSLIFPLDDFPLSDIDADLACLADLNWIRRYDVRGKQYVQVVKWWQHQQMRWAAPSPHPAPDGWSDRLHYRKGADIVEENWAQPEQAVTPPDGDTLAGTVPHGDAKPSATCPPPDGQGTADCPPKSRKEQVRKGENKNNGNMPPPSFAAAAERAFENDIGLIPSAFQQQEIDAMLTELASKGLQDWWQQAIHVACDQNHRSWAYVRGILRNCLQDGRPPGSPKPNGNGHSPPKGNVGKTVDLINQMIAEERAHDAA